MQNAKQATFKQFVLSGNRMQKQERIAVSSHVNVKNAGEQDTRDVYIAENREQAGLRIPLKWSALAILVSVILCFVMAGNKIALTQRLEAEYASMGARFQAAQAEARRLNEVFTDKSDASDICYYAVQSLGMRLAGNQETIGVTAIARNNTGLPQNALGSASTGY